MFSVFLTVMEAKNQRRGVIYLKTLTNNLYTHSWILRLTLYCLNLIVESQTTETRTFCTYWWNSLNDDRMFMFECVAQNRAEEANIEKAIYTLFVQFVFLFPSKTDLYPAITPTPSSYYVLNSIISSDPLGRCTHDWCNGD